MSTSTAYNYELQGAGYTAHRQTDARIAKLVHDALGSSRTVINVGAGAGSYEPMDRYVVAVEPSAVMRSQRPANAAPAVIASAESLPFDDSSFDAGMAMLTIHHWSQLALGLRELRRVVRGPIVILTFDVDKLSNFWLEDYVPEFVSADKTRFPKMERLLDLLEGRSTVIPVAVPIDCTDGFNEAYYARPHAFLDPAVRNAQSAWGLLSPTVIDRAVTQLREDLDSGKWDAKYGYLRTLPEYTCALRLVVNLP